MTSKCGWNKKVAECATDVFTLFWRLLRSFTTKQADGNMEYVFFIYIIKNEKQNVVNGDVIYASFL